MPGINSSLIEKQPTGVVCFPAGRYYLFYACSSPAISLQISGLDLLRVAYFLGSRWFFVALHGLSLDFRGTLDATPYTCIKTRIRDEQVRLNTSDNMKAQVLDTNRY